MNTYLFYSMLGVLCFASSMSILAAIYDKPQKNDHLMLATVFGVAALIWFKAFS